MLGVKFCCNDPFLSENIMCKEKILRCYLHVKEIIIFSVKISLHYFIYYVYLFCVVNV